MAHSQNPAVAQVLPLDIETALIDAVAPLAPPADRAAALRASLMRRVRDAAPRFVTVRSTEGAWVPLAPNIAVKVLDDDGTMQAFLLRLDPGARLPAHDHPAVDEMCVVLEGTVRLGDVEVGAGDYHLAPAGSRHGVLESDTGCVLFLRTRSGTIPIPPMHRSAVAG